MNSTSETLISFISVLDSYGAEEWPLRTVAATSAAFFLGMRYTIGHRNKVDWDACIHAIITGVGAAICVYLNVFAAEHMTGVAEPMGSIGHCNGPLTSLHRIIPAITQGYAVCDIINGFRLGPTYLAHGVATFSVSAAFNELGASHILTPMLIMEVSTMVLAVLRADFFTPTMQLVSQASFALFFFITRIVMSPVILYQIISTMLYHMADCFPNSVFWLTFFFGAFFTSLNVFWFFKLVKKIQGKLSGTDEMEMSEDDM
mmetsp:Transcript_26222/g.40094  ORF Transcript_26222/g.40094 Transcript_26222/m.40094 type:complete len:259 (-) Transcript_26222:212-988(-)|eukprot:CAMPEP_0194118772 /NCGR_PEP_ID=MMETSP0150-20130528/36958_1 /TAXON_ID=122233 /ORGANISM="Chaetoceros debilis, Strain MM31A-1" /LENGTH=258 /DNA_ID=CAMNT_0038810271 /DNA_START=70 /DNA_END=846 /DNA_ORIENTATION=+